MKHLRIGLTVFVAALASWSAPSMAQEFTYRGYVESDLRLSVPGKNIEDLPGEDTLEFIRSDNVASATFCYGTCTSFDGAAGVVDLKVFFTGLWNPDGGFDTLDERSVIDPLYFESDALYVVFKNEIGDSMVLDFALGRQQAIWGTADQFNPTSNLNSYDFQDPIRFGEALANEMITLNFEWLNFEDEDPVVERIALSAAVVPYFRPDQLPRSAAYVFKDPSLFAQFANSPALNGLVEIQSFFLQNGGTVLYDVNVEEPAFTIENIQAGLRYEMKVLGVDTSVSFFRGFDHTPQPTVVDIEGLPDGADLNNLEGLIALLELLPPEQIASIVADTNVVLEYPEMYVLGADFATSIDDLEGLGLWGEVAFFFHDPLQLTLSAGDSQLVDRDDSNCVARDESGTCTTNWFFKFAGGVDFSITEWWYINVQYLYGFVDEFAQRNLGHYIVAGSDFIIDKSQRFVFRLFGIVNPDPDRGSSAVIYPNIFLKYWPNSEISIGSFIYVGDRESKFGSPVTGSSNVFIKARYSY